MVVCIRIFDLGPALGLGHLGHGLGTLTRERTPNVGAISDFFSYFIFLKKCMSSAFFASFLKRHKNLSITRNTMNFSIMVL